MTGLLLVRHQKTFLATPTILNFIILHSSFSLFFALACAHESDSSHGR